MELSAEIREQVQALCAEGEAATEAGDHEEAIDSYWSALELLPEPKTQWEIATHLLVAIGDAYFSADDPAASREALELARHCPGGAENALLHLRLGQSLYHLSVLDHAVDELALAHKLGGSEIFEDEDGRYLALLMTRKEAPPDGW